VSVMLLCAPASAHRRASHGKDGFQIPHSMGCAGGGGLQLRPVDVRPATGSGNKCWASVVWMGATQHANPESEMADRDQNELPDRLNINRRAS